MTNIVDNDIRLTLPLNRYDSQRVWEWFDKEGRTPIHLMLMEFNAAEYSYENIRHALISVEQSGTTPWHKVINEAIKAQAGIVKT